MSLTSYLLSRLPPSVSRLEIVRRFFACPIAEEEVRDQARQLDEKRLECTQLRLAAEGEAAAKRFAEGTSANWQRRAETAERRIERALAVCNDISIGIPATLRLMKKILEETT